MNGGSLGSLPNLESERIISMERISVSHFVLRPSVLFFRTFGLPPHPGCQSQIKVFFGLPNKHGIILVVTVTAWGVVPSYAF